MFSWLFKSPRGDAGDLHSRQWHTAVVFAIGLGLATVGLVWFAYVATREWRRGTDLLQARRAAEALALAHAALVRDMKGAWLDLVVPIDHLDLDEEPPYDLMQQTAQTFAKFPYPESVVIWKGDRPSPRTYVFNRSDRQPHWDHSVRSNDPFPVVLLSDPPDLGSLIEMARQASTSKRPFAVFEMTIAGVPYQIAAHLMFSPDPPHNLSRLVGMTVNLDWVRQEYFGPLLAQIARIGGADDSLPLAVADETGAIVATSGTLKAAGSQLQRRFPLLFLDPNMPLSSTAQSRLPRAFSVRVYDNPSATTEAALTGASRMLALIALAAFASVIALLQTVRAVRASVRLASLKSDFVSAVTHELKTPLVTVRLVADTLAQGRYASPEAIREYARLLSQEASRLSQSIDHLLTYARYANESSMQLERVAIDLIDLVEDAVDRFRPALTEGGFTAMVDVPRELPRVFADPRAVTQVLEIVMDNAIKYSGDARALEISARPRGSLVQLTIADHGIGIHPGDLSHVCERFFRGRNVRASGSGLGLAIAHRILQHHGGDLRIRSEVGVGTEVDVLLPIAP